MWILVEEAIFGTRPVPEISYPKLKEWAKWRQVFVSPNLDGERGLRVHFYILRITAMVLQHPGDRPDSIIQSKNTSLANVHFNTPNVSSLHTTGKRNIFSRSCSRLDVQLLLLFLEKIPLEKTSN